MGRLTIILLTTASLSAAAGQLLFKYGAQGRDNFISFLNIPIFLGLFFYAIGTALWIYALSFEQLVNVYAFTALTFVIVYIGGVLLLGEKLSGLAIVGVCAVLAGLYLIVNHGA